MNYFLDKTTTAPPQFSLFMMSQSLSQAVLFLALYAGPILGHVPEILKKAESQQIVQYLAELPELEIKGLNGQSPEDFINKETIYHSPKTQVLAGIVVENNSPFGK